MGVVDIINSCTNTYIHTYHWSFKIIIRRAETKLCDR